MAQVTGSRQAEYATLKTIFPQVAVFAVQDPADATRVQNLSMIATKDASMDLSAEVRRLAPSLATHRLAGYQAPEGTPLITDDYAPVDQYIIGL